MRLKYLFKFTQGFTLIELMLVAALLSTIGATLYSSFSTGIRIWQRINAEMAVEDTNIFLDKISSELRNTFKIHGIAFRGEGDEMRFPVMWETQKEIGEVHYAFDRKSRSIYRTYRNYSQVYEEKSVPGERIARSIESFQLQYYFYDPEEEEYLWSPTWQVDGEALGMKEEEMLPVAVRIVIGIQEEPLIRTITIPSAGYFLKGKQ